MLHFVEQPFAIFKKAESAMPPDFWPAAMFAAISRFFGETFGSAVPAVEGEKTKWVPCLHLCLRLLSEGRGLIKEHRGMLVSSTVLKSA